MCFHLTAALRSAYSVGLSQISSAVCYCHFFRPPDKDNSNKYKKHSSNDYFIL